MAQWTLSYPDFKYPATGIIQTGGDCSIRVFFKVCVLLKYNMSGAPDKCMGFNSLNFSIIRAHPGPNEFG